MCRVMARARQANSPPTSKFSLLSLRLTIEGPNMASPIGASGSFAIKSDDKGSSITIHISEPSGVSSKNLSLSTWGASFVLANHLHKIPVPSQSTILELGAGTGLVGLSAAAIWKANVILTDLPAIVPGLEANISLNQKLLWQSGSIARAGSLDWTGPNEIVLSNSKRLPQQDRSNRPHVILAADTIYDEDHPELLCEAITSWLTPGPKSRAVLCYPLRMAYIDHIRDFWERMETAGLECCAEGKEAGDEKWNEIAHTPYEWCVWRWKSQA